MIDDDGDAGKAPNKTFAIWATDGVCGMPGDVQLPLEEGDPKSMRWLLENRSDFGSNGWDALLDVGKMRFATVGGNHFTMMRQPAVSLILFFFLSVIGRRFTCCRFMFRYTNCYCLFR